MTKPINYSETPMGRPTVYTEDIANEICARLSDGESLLRITKDPHLPSKSTIHRWLFDDDKKEFWDKYKRARDEQAETLIDEIVDIADDGTNDWMEREHQNGNTYTVLNGEHVQRSRLRIDTRKWYASKVLPKKYGEKLDLTSKGEAMTVMFDSSFNNKDNQEDTDETTQDTTDGNTG